MIIILKLITGDEIVGSIACTTKDEINNLSHYVLKNPMWVVPGPGGTMKLCDACLISENDELIFKPNHTITYYIPSTSLINYYTQASEIAKSFAKIAINAQIDHAARDLELALHYEKEEAARQPKNFSSITSSKLH